MPEPMLAEESHTPKRKLARGPLLVGAGIAVAGLLLIGTLVALALNGGLGTLGDAGSGETSESESTSTARSNDATIYPPGSPDRPKKEKPVIAPEVSSDEVRSELQAAFDTQVLEVKVQASGSSVVRIDITSSLPFAAESVVTALEIAESAARSAAVRAAYPSATVSAYVWPKEGSAYMVRATVVWEDGALAQPVNTYTDEALR